ncbi:MAG: PAS domain-containing protein [Burkholderiales bacterium]|nr:PAS domain-containing protein [Burkholderiales bacterium]
MTDTAGLELISTAVLLMTAGRRIAYANPAAENLFAQSRRQLVGARLGDVLRDAERLTPALDLALTHRASYTEQEIELHLAGKTNGHARLLVNCTATFLDSPHASDPQLIVEFRPIDQQLKIAREAKIAEQNQANRELVRNLAHEIKNPLGGIRGAAQLLEGELSEPQLVEYTQVIIGEADRLQNLVNKLLTPHKLPRYVRTDIHVLLDRVLQLLKNEFGATHTLEADFDVSLPEPELDGEQITQVLLNIARNACQSTAAVSSPEVTLRTRVARQVVLAKRRYRMALEVAVVDNGPGVPLALRDRIFYPLFTTRTDGTGSGLGLSIAQTFVAQHYGVIEVDSEPGHTEFRVILPFDHPAEPPSHADTKAKP